MPDDIERQVGFLLAAGDITPRVAMEILAVMGSPVAAARTAAVLRQEADGPKLAEPQIGAAKLQH